MADIEHNSLSDIGMFFRQQRIAAVGVSRNPRDFTRGLMREFIQRGYDVVPVNPGTREIEGRSCYATVSAIEPPVDAALLLTPAALTEQVVRDCAACGVNLIWMYRAGGVGAVSEPALKFCRERGLRVIAGECPYMFLPHTGWPHRLHGLIKKIAGAYPR